MRKFILLWSCMVGVTLSGGAFGAGYVEPKNFGKTELSPELRASQERAKKELAARQAARLKKEREARQADSVKNSIRTPEKTRTTQEEVAHTTKVRRKREETEGKALVERK